MEKKNLTISQYLIHRLKELGVEHAFGVCGDYIIGFLEIMLQLKKKDSKNSIELITCCNELNAAYASDGYARIKGLGCFISTYAVGELSGINGIAGAFAERVPVVVITGMPPKMKRESENLLHHSLGDFKKTKKIYKEITVDSVILDNPETAASDIDRVLVNCLYKMQPVYIGLPTDMLLVECQTPKKNIEWMNYFITENVSLDESLNEVLEMINKSKKPIIVAGMELIRYKLQPLLKKLLEVTGFPYVTMMLDKCVLDEEHPQFIGLYEGKRSREYVRKRVEESDCVLLLGTLMTDFNTGSFSAHIPVEKSIEAHIFKLKIKNHYYENIYLKDFINKLIEKLSEQPKKDIDTLDIRPAIHECIHRVTKEFKPNKSAKLTVQRFFDKISHCLPKNSVILADVGCSIFSAAETFMPSGTTFIGQGFYSSIGYTLGATLGACIACPDRPVILFIGDGSFQMTCQELSSLIKYKCKPQIFLLNNKGYTIERMIIDNIYNDLQVWKYHLLPMVFGGKEGYDIKTEGELEEVLLKISKENEKDLIFMEIHTEPYDCTDAMKEAGISMKKVNYLSNLEIPSSK